jgi:hypothetical protein
MHIPSPVKYGIAAVSLAGAALMPTLASAQTLPSNMPEAKWQFSASLYGYFPTIGGSTTFPGLPGNPSPSLSIDASTIIDNLKMVFMGSFDAHNGQWGLWNDVLYMNVGNSKSATRDFSLINGVIPASATANLSLDIKSTIWTIAGEYRLYNADPAWTNDLLFGARMVSMTNTLGYSFSGTIGQHALAGRSGTVEASETLWDAIIGVKGKYAFGANREWFVPYYLDVGTGQSQLTWQAAGGVGYRFGWGDVSAMWRYMDYNMKSGKPIESLNLNGPLIAATFRW